MRFSSLPGTDAGTHDGIDAGPLALWAGLFTGADPASRLSMVEDALEGKRGRYWRAEIGKWIGRLVPVETLVPDSSRRWRPLVRDSFQFLFERLSDRRLATKVVEQFELPAGTAPEQRLLRLVNKMPGLQKAGQVLARNRRLSSTLRRALSELENGMSDVTPQQVRRLIEEGLGNRLQAYAVELEPAILSEASVSAVIRFTWNRPDREREQGGVQSLLKPYVPDCFSEDIRLLRSLGEFLSSPRRGYGFAVHEVREMLAEALLLLARELDFRREQATLAEAARMYRASIERVPRLIAPLSTGKITAMSAEAGVKVTEAASIGNSTRTGSPEIWPEARWPPSFQHDN